MFKEVAGSRPHIAEGRRYGRHQTQTQWVLSVREERRRKRVPGPASAFETWVLGRDLTLFCCSSLHSYFWFILLKKLFCPLPLAYIACVHMHAHMLVRTCARAHTRTQSLSPSHSHNAGRRTVEAKPLGSLGEKCDVETQRTHRRKQFPGMRKETALSLDIREEFCLLT